MEVDHILAGTGGTGSSDGIVLSQVISQSVVNEQTVLVINFGTRLKAQQRLHCVATTGGTVSLNDGWYEVQATEVECQLQRIGQQRAGDAGRRRWTSSTGCYGDLAHTGLVSSTDLSILHSVSC